LKTYQHEPACCTGAEIIRIGLAVVVAVAIGIGGAGVAIVRGGCRKCGKAYRWAARWYCEMTGERDMP
jgi:hypothetical protein